MSDPERIWIVTYSCGHTARVSTVIGDMDYLAHHPFPEPCPTFREDDGCKELVMVTSAELDS